MRNVPALVLVAHGTANATGQRTVLQVRAQVQRRLPGVRVVDAYVDVQLPRLRDVVDSLVREEIPTVIVPLLLSTGYHVEVDVARAAAAPLVTAAPPLGPHPVLAQILRDRLAEAGATTSDPVVLAAAGSSRPGAALAVQVVAERLALLRPGRVTAGFASATTPSVEQAIADATTEGRRVYVASYLLGHGFFHERLRRLDARVTAPIGADRRIAELAIERYRTAARSFSTRPVPAFVA
ncbi:sirohydrochlorin chelatase [Flexivirga caeni]|uniref:Sirohydrochlorin chelatase n=1 Tax=Flexivirga caeni TaxID=2294115 RepID=A0A3M9MIG1_9MICO|nr:CbiX/SirB N-terminal domain-containing protein [Flexivirga caeni]RNI25296.1 sirohydrochlorin chelatase [Flexivirga caeni]